MPGLSRRRVLVGGSCLLGALGGCASTEPSGMRDSTSPELTAELLDAFWGDLDRFGADRSYEASIRSLVDELGAVTFPGVLLEIKVLQAPADTCLVIPGRVAISASLTLRSPEWLLPALAHQSAHLKLGHVHARFAEFSQITFGFIAMACPIHARSDIERVAAALGAGDLYGLRLPFNMRDEVAAMQAAKAYVAMTNSGRRMPLIEDPPINDAHPGASSAWIEGPQISE